MKAHTRRNTRYVVVDLETTGAHVEYDTITEVGAVAVCDGRVLAEFQTLVNPEREIDGFVSALTGITDSMVSHAPLIHKVLPSFYAFARDSVLVAHNASFDIGFLCAASQRVQLPWPDFTVLDTVLLARELLTREEVSDYRLATLAKYFGAATTPTHRALMDARATTDVFAGLCARAAVQACALPAAVSITW